MGNKKQKGNLDMNNGWVLRTHTPTPTNTGKDPKNPYTHPYSHGKRP